MEELVELIPVHGTTENSVILVLRFSWLEVNMNFIFQFLSRLGLSHSKHGHLEDGNCNVCKNIGQVSIQHSLNQKPKFHGENT
jgi:hypothetical protein